jgi:hypothetical protein
MTVNSELEGMWKEVIMDELKVSSRNFPGETEENHKMSENMSLPKFELGISRKQGRSNAA